MSPWFAVDGDERRLTTDGLLRLCELLGFNRLAVPFGLRSAAKMERNLPFPDGSLLRRRIHVHNMVTYICFDMRENAPDAHRDPASFFGAMAPTVLYSGELRRLYFSVIKEATVLAESVFDTSFTSNYGQFTFSSYINQNPFSSSSSLLLESGAAAAMDVSDSAACKTKTLALPPPWTSVNSAA